MKRWIAIVLAFAAAPLPASAQQACGKATPITIDQRSYMQLLDPMLTKNRRWLYLYVPDIKRHTTGPGFRTFKLWLVEGVYGYAFADSRGPIENAEFENIRKSPNVRAMSINVEYDAKNETAAAVPRSVTIGEDTFNFDVNPPRFRLFKNDSLTLRICR